MLNTLEGRNGSGEFARRSMKNLDFILDAARNSADVHPVTQMVNALLAIPTAGDMIAEFKQRLLVSQRRVSPASVADLSNLLVLSVLQAHIDSSGQFPPAGAPDEYAALFEAVRPAERDRQTFLDSDRRRQAPIRPHRARHCAKGSQGAFDLVDQFRRARAGDRIPHSQ